MQLPCAGCVHRKILKLFRSLGQFVAKALLDSRIIDVPLSMLFVSQMLGRNLKPSLQLVSLIDPALARSLQSLQDFVVEKKRIYSLNLPSKEREVALKNIEVRGSTLENMCLDFGLVGYAEVELKVRELGHSTCFLSTVLYDSMRQWVNRVLTVHVMSCLIFAGRRWRHPSDDLQCGRVHYVDGGHDSGPWH